MISAAEQRLSDSGRINVRMSGTEPKLRIMVEAAEASLMQDVGQTLFDEMKTYLDSRS